MFPTEPTAHRPNPGRTRIGGRPSPVSTELEPKLEAFLHDALLDPRLWRQRLAEFARATGLAVGLADGEGRLLGECILPGPRQDRLPSTRSPVVEGCPFYPVPLDACTCIRDAMAGRRVVVRNGPGPWHCAVALSLGDHPIGVLLAGQALDESREPDRAEQPVSEATLGIYAELLGTLGHTILETHHRALRETAHLDEMTRLRDNATAEIATRRVVEKRHRFLLAVSDEFDYRNSDATLRRLARQAVPFLADLCFVDVVEADETIRRVGWAHADPARRDLFGRIDQFVPPRNGQDHPVSRVLRNGQVELVPEVTDSWMQAVAASPQHVEFMRELELRSVMTVPLVAQERMLGAFTFCYTATSERRYTALDVHLAEDLAHRAAKVVENAGLYRALQVSDRHKDEFLGVLAHELRGPLAPIHNAIQILRTRVPADPELRWTSAVIEHQVEQITRLVDDLLDVVRIGQGMVHLRKDLVDLAKVAARAVDSSRPLIDAKKQHLEITLPERVIEVEGDQLRLVQVVVNLLTNSAKYTEEGGRIELTLDADADLAILRVRDTGVGIAADMLPRIFDLFTQVSGQHDRSEGGLGIGLSLVRDLVDRHGGNVQATSPGLGQGSEFVVRLPLLRRAPSPPPAAEGRTEATAQEPSRRILVIDDNQESADTMAILLRVHGHEVWTAYDGPTALDLARLQPPEVVLCDVSMPGMGGLEVARRLRQDLGLCDALLVAWTGHGEQEDMQRSREAGFNAHMVKPIRLAAVRAILAREGPPAPRFA